MNETIIDQLCSTIDTLKKAQDEVLKTEIDQPIALRVCHIMDKDIRRLWKEIKELKDSAPLEDSGPVNPNTAFKHKIT